eukprot:110578-Rhodomonas_salina.1
MAILAGDVVFKAAHAQTGTNLQAFLTSLVKKFPKGECLRTLSKLGLAHRGDAHGVQKDLKMRAEVASGKRWADITASDMLFQLSDNLCFNKKRGFQQTVTLIYIVVKFAVMSELGCTAAANQ